ncbi:MAG: hypothetical protein QM528_00115 [Phycisphaerales bacterium]|nr:hypothetical protein [Phycisphaerales bacterium]
MKSVFFSFVFLFMIVSFSCNKKNAVVNVTPSFSVSVFTPVVLAKIIAISVDKNERPIASDTTGLPISVTISGMIAPYDSFYIVSGRLNTPSSDTFYYPATNMNSYTDVRYPLNGTGKNITPILFAVSDANGKITYVNGDTLGYRGYKDTIPSSVAKNIAQFTVFSKRTNYYENDSVAVDVPLNITGMSFSSNANLYQQTVQVGVFDSVTINIARWNGLFAFMRILDPFVIRNLGVLGRFGDTIRTQPNGLGTYITPGNVLFDISVQDYKIYYRSYKTGTGAMDTIRFSIRNIFYGDSVIYSFPINVSQ